MNMQLTQLASQCDITIMGTGMGTGLWWVGNLVPVLVPMTKPVRNPQVYLYPWCSLTMTCKMTTKQAIWWAHFLHQPPWQLAQKPSWESTSWLLLQFWSQNRACQRGRSMIFIEQKSGSMLWDSYYTISIYWVVTDHRWPYWMHIWFCQFGLNLVPPNRSCSLPKNFRCHSC